jgi:group I intron endonuclease
MQSTSLYLIYKHTCSITGKSYIGQTKNLKQRSKAHRRSDSNCTIFRNAIRKYGWNQFSTELLSVQLTADQANNLEPYFIIEHNTLTPNGYNIATGGLNHQHSTETKKKISESNKGKHRQPKTIEQKEKISQSLRFRKVPFDVIEKRSKATRGRKRSPEHILKTVLANTGKKRTEEQKHRMSVAQTGRVVSIETKKKMANAHKGKSQPKTVCPHCNKTGAASPMSRWHFNNCKVKK